MLLGYLLIATERITGINKAAVAMFLGTLGWMLYVAFGNDFVMAQHQVDYSHFLSGVAPNSESVKDYIAQNVLINYVGKAAEIVLFLLATMTIVEILTNNGCFDHLSQWFRTRNSGTMMLMICGVTVLLSANLDNLTTTMLMLGIMHQIIPSRKHRATLGTAIVVSANIGGALTVIGDTNGLLLWNMGAVTPSRYSAWMILPCLSAWGVSMVLLWKQLPPRLDIERAVMPYRGDDTNLNTWQRIVMFFFAVAGLWFIPTFHNITHLSPFLGALCTLSLIWIVNELFNRKLMISQQRVERRMPIALQYSRLQTLLFVMGIMLCTGVLIETGGTLWLGHLLQTELGDIFTVYAAPLLAAIVSMFLDTFASASAFFSLYNVEQAGELGQNGEYWILIAYATAVGSSILCIGSLSGIVLMKMENITLGRYVRSYMTPVMAGSIVGLIVLVLEVMSF